MSLYGMPAIEGFGQLFLPAPLLFLHGMQS